MDNHQRTLLGGIGRLPHETVFIILGNLFHDGTGYESGPGFILDEESPSSPDRRFFARSVAHINRSFNKVAMKFLWTKVNIDTHDDLEYLAQAANCNPSLGAMTKWLDITIRGPVPIPLLDRLLQSMNGLETFIYHLNLPTKHWAVPSSYHRSVETTHSDHLIMVLNACCSSLRTVVFETYDRRSPSGSGLWELLRTQTKLEILHFDSMSPRFISSSEGYDRSIPEIPPSFKAESLRVLSLGDWGDEFEDWNGNTELVSEFWERFPANTFPNMEKLCFQAFNPKLLPFISHQSKSIRHLQITSSDKYFYAHPSESIGVHILEVATNVEHLTWRLGVPHKLDVGLLKDWKPLSIFNPTLHRITILPDSYHCNRNRYLGRLLKRALNAILEADLPRLGIVEIKDTIGKREDIVRSDWFQSLEQKLRVKGNGEVVVAILDTGASGWELDAPQYSSDISI
jgi:hypothetical protein